MSADKSEWSPLAGKLVVLCPDNDAAGEEHAKRTLDQLSRLTPAPTVKVVRLDVDLSLLGFGEDELAKARRSRTHRHIAAADEAVRGEHAMRDRPKRSGGYVTEFGYRRIMAPGERRLKMEHVLVWERRHGPVPSGKELHHINGDKLDNRIENLQLVTRLEHKRIHSGCVLRDGVWWKRCRKCQVLKPETDYYEYPGRNGLMGLCKRCCIRLAVKYRQRRRRRAEQISDRSNAPVKTEASEGVI